LAPGERVKAQKCFDGCVSLTRDATVKGDPVDREDCYQHADHFWRVMKDLTGSSLDP
jgi:hypothetical protein